MGRGRHRGRTQRKDFKESRENVWKRSKSDEQPPQLEEGDSISTDNTVAKPHPTWEPFTTQNPAFDEYYQEQGIVASEEWDAFMVCLRSALPAAFRINSSNPFYKDILWQLENDFMKSLQAEDANGSEIVAIKPLPWYPDNLAWHSNFSRKQLRKNQILERFHAFLKLQNEIGNITRQEAVSMVPPLFLDVRPDHLVLDMCAAPGSKTFQLLEMIHLSSRSLPSGMVVANDVDIKRCNLLIHQTKRMCTANLFVTTHEAQHFPSCRFKRTNTDALDSELQKNPEISQLLFDRVLCDVPCSGDGTLRKAPDIWKKWNHGMGNGLHGLQVLIAMRGLSLLKVGGRMVYSTCSMNPIENEAVVSEILRRCKGAVELLDVSTELPQLIRRPGLKTWKVRDKGMWLTSYKDVTKNRRAAVVPGMFPSGNTYEDVPENDHGTTPRELSDSAGNEKPENGSSTKDSVVLMDNVEKEVSTLPLERCMRIVPHDQNTGAFFIAVLHKLSSLPAVEKKPVNSSGKSRSNNKLQAEEAAVEIKEDIDMVEENPETVLDGKVTEVNSEADVPISGTNSGTDVHDDEKVEADVDMDDSTVLEEKETKEIQPSNSTTGTEAAKGKRKLQVQGRWIGVDPVLFYKEETVICKIKEFYGIDDSFPFLGHLVSRNSDTSHVKRIYYISNSVKEVLELNLASGQPLKIASIGIKMFERQTSKEGTSSPCAFRISSEGLPLILPYVTKQILYASAVDFKNLLQYKTVKFADFTDAEFGDKASKLMMGCCIVVLKDNRIVPDQNQLDASTIAIGCWRGRTNVSVMVPAVDCEELLTRILEKLEKIKSPLQESEPTSCEAIEVLKENDIEDVMPPA